MSFMRFATALFVAVPSPAATVRERLCGRVGGFQSNRFLTGAARFGLGAVLFGCWFTAGANADSPFATVVVDFAPAPGQFANVSDFNDPARALGAPVGGGTHNQDNTKLVSIGGFGGSITLGFDHRVMDDPGNPFGMDAIVFGNAHWVGFNNNRHWAECGYVEISRDDNENGIIDDAWYLIPGSHIIDPNDQWTMQTWDDNIEDLLYPPHPVNPEFPYQNWIWPGQSGVWTTSAYRLPAIFDTTVLVNPNGLSATQEGVWGYADFAPVIVLGDLDADNIVDDPNITPELFYTTPDDPLEVGISPNASGGDAFDIAWAIDADTGLPAQLDGFDFIRITNGVNMVNDTFGEISTEIGGVADVRDPTGDMNCDGATDIFDIDAFVLAILDEAAYAAVYTDCNWLHADCNLDGYADVFDIDAFVALIVGGQK